MTPFDFHGSKPVEYYLHMIGHIPQTKRRCKIKNACISVLKSYFRCLRAICRRFNSTVVVPSSVTIAAYSIPKDCVSCINGVVVISIYIICVTASELALITAVFKVKCNSVTTNGENIVFRLAAAASVIVAIISIRPLAIPMTPLIKPVVTSIIAIAYCACNLPAC